MQKQENQKVVQKLKKLLYIEAKANYNPRNHQSHSVNKQVTLSTAQLNQGKQSADICKSLSSSDVFPKRITLATSDTKSPKSRIQFQSAKKANRLSLYALKNKRNLSQKLASKTISSTTCSWNGIEWMNLFLNKSEVR